MKQCPAWFSRNLAIFFLRNRVRKMLLSSCQQFFRETRMNWPKNTWGEFEVLCWPEVSITNVVTTGKYNIILFSSKIPIILHLTVVVTTSWNPRFRRKNIARLREKSRRIIFHYPYPGSFMIRWMNQFFSSRHVVNIVSLWISIRELFFGKVLSLPLWEVDFLSEKIEFPSQVQDFAV